MWLWQSLFTSQLYNFPRIKWERCHVTMSMWVYQTFPTNLLKNWTTNSCFIAPPLVFSSEQTETLCFLSFSIKTLESSWIPFYLTTYLESISNSFSVYPEFDHFSALPLLPTWLFSYRLWFFHGLSTSPPASISPSLIAILKWAARVLL
jgi:hypothetical protein